MKKRKERQETCRSVAKAIGVEHIPSFESGVKWADYHPNWQEGIPEREENQYGLPKLYLCQILILDMTFGYRYSYRVGFVNKEKKWSVENSNTKVTRYLEIFCDESIEQLANQDIPEFEKTEDEEETDEEIIWYNKEGKIKKAA